MNKPIVSAKVRELFREYFVSNKVLRTIKDAFDWAGIVCDTDFRPDVTWERRFLIEQYYHTINWSDWKDVQKIIQIYENELIELQEQPDSGDMFDYEAIVKRQEDMIKKFLLWLKRDNFTWSDGKLKHSAFFDTTVGDLSKDLHQLDSQYLSQQIQRMNDSIDNDPDLAIWTAKELIESVCKTILEERGLWYDKAHDIPVLTKNVLRELQLVPEWVSDEKRWAEIIKRILRSLWTIGNDIAELRWLYGTGHGKHIKSKNLTPRHAKLAVGVAATFVKFIFETHQESPSK